MTIKRITSTTLLAIFWFISFGTDFHKPTTDLNVRGGPGTNYEVLFTLSITDEVEVLSTEKNWSKIEFNGQRGYASTKYLKYTRSVDSSTNEFQKDDDINFKYIVIGIIVMVVILIII